MVSGRYLMISVAAGLLMSCGGGGGSSPPVSVTPPPPPPPPAPPTLTVDTALSAKSDFCFQGGSLRQSGPDTNGNGTLDASEIETEEASCNATSINPDANFRRTAFFPACDQPDLGCNLNSVTNAESVDATSDGNTLVYTDRFREVLGLVDITNASLPIGLGTIALTGRPTSVAVKDQTALVAMIIETGSGPSGGQVAIVDIPSRAVLRTINLGGAPDAIAISPDRSKAVIAVENEGAATRGTDSEIRDGFIGILDISADDTASWSLSSLSLSASVNGGLVGPEPESVDINMDNIAAITLQENNHVVLVDLASETVSEEFTAGSLLLDGIDIDDERPREIDQTQALNVSHPRQPDGIVWISAKAMATINEGERNNSGTRDFTVFEKDGTLVHTEGNAIDRHIARIGHYPDKRSDERGSEPESADIGNFGDERYLLIATERSHNVLVYNAADPANPVFKQILPASTSPESVKTIEGRNLFVVASLSDDRGNHRAGITIYEYGQQTPTYPVLESVDRSAGIPIPWASLSGLGADLSDPSLIYAVDDGFFNFNRIFHIDISVTPARIVDEIFVTDPDGLIADLPVASLTRNSGAFDAKDREDLVNADGTVNLDPEGIVPASGGGFWIAAEGKGTYDSTLFEPIESRNRIFKTNADGVITDIISLPDNVNLIQSKYGFAGIAESNGKLVVPFERDWNNEVTPRIGIFDVASRDWQFVFYDLDNAASQNGGTVNLSGITAIGNDKYLVLERDDQGGSDAAIRRIYEIDLSNATDGAVIPKSLRRDLIASGDIPAAGGQIMPKLEGLTVTADGNFYVISDNDGVEEGSGETVFKNLGNL